MEHNKLLSFKSIFLKVPRKKILKSLKKDSIDSKEFGFYMHLRTKTQKSIYKAQHLLSILERLLRKNLFIRR